LKNIDIVLVSISNPILIGIYLNEALIDTITSDEKTSDVISDIFEEILKKYNINTILYTSSPGSHLSTKLVYVYIKTLSIVKGINIKSVDGFFFNNNNPIKGIMGKYFVKTNKEILLKTLKINDENIKFQLPQHIDMKQFSSNIEPVYVAPAVY